MRINGMLCTYALGVMVGCGGGSGSPSGGTPTGGAGSGAGKYVQYAVLAVTGDSASGLQPYEGAAEVEYDSASYYAPKFNLGAFCNEVYDSSTSTNGVADTTSISCDVTAPSVQGSPDSGVRAGTGGSGVAFTFEFKGRPSPGLEITLASPSLVKLHSQLFDALGLMATPYSPSADVPPDGRGSFSDFSFKIGAVTAIPSLVPSPPSTTYVLDAEGHATMADTIEFVPGTMSVSLTMSANSPISGAPEGGVVVGTCSDLTACCNAIADATAKATCSQLETTYQGMVGAGFTQMQADSACSTFLQLERKGTLCP